MSAGAVCGVVCCTNDHRKKNDPRKLYVCEFSDAMKGFVNTLCIE